MIAPMKLQLAYLTTDLSAIVLNPFAFTLPLIAAQTVYQPFFQNQAYWMQISHMPLQISTTVPIVCEKKFIRGFVDTDVAGTLNIYYSDNENNVIDPPAAGSSVKASNTIAIPGNAVGSGTAIAITMPGGKFVRVAFTNGAVAQARFTLMLLLCDENQ